MCIRDRVSGVIDMAGPPEPVADPGDTDVGGQPLNLTTAAGTPGAVLRVVGQVELHHAAAQRIDLGGPGRDGHAVDAGRRARGRSPFDPVDLDEAEPAGAERGQGIGGAQPGDRHARQPLSLIHI